jgi:hypothetical protein
MLESPHILYVSGYLSDKELDHTVIPRFAPRPPGLQQSVKSGSMQMAMLLEEAALSFFFAQWAFHRMELA